MFSRVNSELGPADEPFVEALNVNVAGPLHSRPRWNGKPVDGTRQQKYR